MAAYRPPEQLLFSPVSNFYKGKAIRAGLAADERKLDQADERIELEKKRTDISERQAKVQEDTLDLNRERFENDVGRDAASKAAFDAYSITQEVDGLFQAGGKTPEAESESLQVAAERFSGYAASLPDGEAKDALLAKLQDGLTSDEYRSIRPAVERAAKYYGHLGLQENVTLAEGAQLRAPDGTLIAENPKDFAPPKDASSSAKPLTTPTNAETEMVSDRVDVVMEKLDDEDYDIKASDKGRMKDWVGEAAKAIMEFEASRGNAMGMNSAVDRALSEGQKFLVTDAEPNLFLDGDKSFIPPQHLIGQHIELQGRVYVVTEYDDDGEPMVVPVD